ncbi:hypothetical protein [Chitinivorax sp. B]|uniref:hypothetical protein n=1 Tax=Chitinivorax sp. B TaxID=2502235 RepID=UPI0010F52CA1|nr:hypothetical protein [Chitinivorax sp. B]
MKRMTLAAILVLSLVTIVPAQAMGNWGGGDSQTDDVDYSAGKTALKAENWQGAIEAMNKVVARYQCL